MRNVSGVMADHAWLATGRNMAENVENTVRNGGIAGGDCGYDGGVLKISASARRGYLGSQPHWRWLAGTKNSDISGNMSNKMLSLEPTVAVSELMSGLD